MTPAELVKRLLAEQDLKYRDFHASLLPNIDKKSIIGVRVPTMRKIAKEFVTSATPAELDKFCVGHFFLSQGLFPKKKCRLFRIG